MKKLFFFCALVFSSLAVAIPEATVPSDWSSKALTFYNGMTVGSFRNAQGRIIKFRYSFKAGATKTIVLLPGRTESILHFAETLYDLNSPAVNLASIDHQGQGESDRLLKNTQKGYVEHFQDYVKDIDQWMSSFVIPASLNTEKYLLAHSMGATIGAYYLKLRPNAFKKAVFNAPMFEANTAPYPETLAKDIAGFYVLIGRGSDYVFGGHDYDPKTDVFAKTTGTHSEARFNADKNISLNFPKLLVSSATMRWVHESIGNTQSIDKDVAPKITIPLLIFQAGKDQTVKNPRQNSFCKKAKNCTLFVFPDAYHRILIEKDDIRELALLKIRMFFGI